MHLINRVRLKTSLYGICICTESLFLLISTHIIIHYKCCTTVLGTSLPLPPPLLPPSLCQIWVSSVELRDPEATYNVYNIGNLSTLWNMVRPYLYIRSTLYVSTILCCNFVYFTKYIIHCYILVCMRLFSTTGVKD